MSQLLLGELIREAMMRFESILRQREAAKSTFVQMPGDLGSDLFLVTSGLLRSFHLVKSKDVTAHFAMENGIVGAIDSVVSGAPSRYGIEALEDSEFLALDTQELEVFLAAHPENERLARQITLYLYADLVERFEGMLFLSAQERYTHLLARYPGITRRVALGHIASYLGMSQETLSRVRSQRRF
ncbi:MAG: Crp/Fnr family transcriptional regulator [Myxococcota bacterium]